MWRDPFTLSFKWSKAAVGARFRACYLFFWKKFRKWKNSDKNLGNSEIFHKLSSKNSKTAKYKIFRKWAFLKIGKKKPALSGPYFINLTSAFHFYFQLFKKFCKNREFCKKLFFAFSKSVTSSMPNCEQTKTCVLP